MRFIICYAISPRRAMSSAFRLTKIDHGPGSDFNIHRAKRPLNVIDEYQTEPTISEDHTKGDVTMGFFNGPPTFKLGIQQPTCFHGIRQTAEERCECGCNELELLGLKQDTGGGHVDLHNGQFRLVALDLQIPGRGFDWKFERTFLSGTIFTGPLGNGWDFNYNRRLLVNPNGDVGRIDGYGRIDRYASTVDGFLSPPGYYTRLTRRSDDTFLEIDLRRSRVLYAPPDERGIALMLQMSDRNGNKMVFRYNEQAQLAAVLDTLGREIVYIYDDSGRLHQVIDFTGRAITFEYSAVTSDLTAVTSPPIVGTPNGNDFPTGRRTEYRYTLGLPDERLNHNLSAVIAPNETAINGPPRLHVEYEEEPGLRGDFPTAGRVRSLTHGGTNRSTIPAGGTTSYSYDSSGPPVTRTTVTNRNGNQTVYEFDDLGYITGVGNVNNRNLHIGFPQVFETVLEYNRDGETTSLMKPEGNVILYTYDHDNPDRLQQGNLLSKKEIPHPNRGGDQDFIITEYTYDPIYSERITSVDGRGTDHRFVPPDGETPTPGRYTMTSILDYQEGSDAAGLASALELQKTKSASFCAEPPYRWD